MLIAWKHICSHERPELTLPRLSYCVLTVLCTGCCRKNRTIDSLIGIKVIWSKFDAQWTEHTYTVHHVAWCWWWERLWGCWIPVYRNYTMLWPLLGWCRWMFDESPRVWGRSLSYAMWGYDLSSWRLVLWQFLWSSSARDVGSVG